MRGQGRTSEIGLDLGDFLVRKRRPPFRLRTQAFSARVHSLLCVNMDALSPGYPHGLAVGGFYLCPVSRLAGHGLCRYRLRGAIDVLREHHHPLLPRPV